MAATKDSAAGLEPIDPAKVYPLEIFKRVSGQSDWALRQARRGGLRVTKAGRRKYVRGSDWIAYLDGLPEAS